MAEAAQGASAAGLAQVVKTDAALLTVDLYDQIDIVGELASLAPCACSFGEVKTYLLPLWLAPSIL